MHLKEKKSLKLGTLIIIILRFIINLIYNPQYYTVKLNSSYPFFLIYLKLMLEIYLINQTTLIY